jgi:hypothetical protein
MLNQYHLKIPPEKAGSFLSGSRICDEVAKRKFPTGAIMKIIGRDVRKIYQYRQSIVLQLRKNTTNVYKRL